MRIVRHYAVNKKKKKKNKQHVVKINLAFDEVHNFFPLTCANFTNYTDIQGKL